jgi:hypothetical protein
LVQALQQNTFLAWYRLYNRTLPWLGTGSTTEHFSCLGTGTTIKQSSGVKLDLLVSFPLIIVK